MQIISRSEAKGLGLARYFTGNPCSKGHICERLVCSHKCVECNRKISSDWKKENRNKVNMWAKKVYCKEIDKKRPSRNKEFFAAKQAKRRSKIKNAKGSHSKDDIAKILENQKYKCANCFAGIKNSYHVDHIIPISKGGSNCHRNIQGLCPNCNRSKYNKMPDVWAMENGRLI